VTAPRLAIIVPTVRRPSLQRTLGSIADAGIACGDTVAVVVDSLAAMHQRSERSVYPADVNGPGFRRVLQAGAAVVTKWIAGPHNDYGGAARNAALDMVIAHCGRTVWVAYVDDDDVLLPGALTTIRQELARRDPRQPELHIFRARVNDPRVRTAADGCLWIDRDLRVGNVTTCMLVHSLVPLFDRDTRWRTDRYEHDYLFAQELVDDGYELHWHETTIASLRPAGDRT